MPEQEIELSIVMPCLNEAKTLVTCLQKARRFLYENKVNGEIIVADNGSTDGSQTIAIANEARIVQVHVRGYGAAVAGGVAAARGRYVIMADADDSYDFLALMPLLMKLREGYQLVMGNRFKGGIKPGAMPFLNRYLGNPVLSALGKLFFRIPVNDFHCGLRGFFARSTSIIGSADNRHGICQRDDRTRRYVRSDDDRSPGNLGSRRSRTQTASVAVARRLAAFAFFFCFTVRAGFIFIRAWQ